MPGLAAENAIAARIEAELGSQCLADDPEEFLVDGSFARVVAAPGRRDELSELLALASRERWTVVPAGHGTWLDAGNPLRRADLVVTTKRLDRVIDHSPDDLVATVEAGASRATLAETCASGGQWWPLDPLGGGTVGATIATGSAGPLALAYGAPRDLVLGLTLVLADGRVVEAGGRVVKNVAGYDMVRLFTGSWGTLGFITQAHLRLHPIPPADETRVFAADRHGPLLDLAAELDDATALGPAAAEILAPDAAGALDLEDGRWHLLVRWLGHAAAVADATARADERAGGQGAESLPHPKVWRAFQGVESRLGSALTVRVDVPRRSTGEVLALTRAFSGGRVPPLSAAPLTGRIWIFVPIDLYDEAPGERTWPLRLRDLRQVAGRRGGCVRVERAPGSLRKIIDAWGDAGAALRLQRGIKTKFDPTGILNPGRLAGGV